MKNVHIFALLIMVLLLLFSCQDKAIVDVIDKYSEARENNDTILLKSILTNDIDQLVSSGEWRYGVEDAIKGMMESTSGNPGKRVLTVEKIRILNSQTVIADARYEIQRPDGNVRKMWSTFVLVIEDNTWKIAAIRNMLPTGGG